MPRGMLRYSQTLLYEHMQRGMVTILYEQAPGLHSVLSYIPPDVNYILPACLSRFRSRPLPLSRDTNKAHTRTRSWRHRRVWLLAASIAEHCFSTTSPRVDASNDISEPPLLTLNHTAHVRTFHLHAILDQFLTNWNFCFFC